MGRAPSIVSGKSESGVEKLGLVSRDLSIRSVS